VWYSNTQNDFSPRAAIFSLHTLAPPSGRIVKYDEKQLTGGKKLSCSLFLYRFRKYVSYDFPIINVCNPGVHHETPCRSGKVDSFLSNYFISNRRKSVKSVFILLVWVNLPFGHSRCLADVTERAGNAPLFFNSRNEWRRMFSVMFWLLHKPTNCDTQEDTKPDGWIRRDQLDVTCFIISLFNAQHVSDVNTSILRSLRLIC